MSKPDYLDEPDAVWAHVIRESEMEEPALLDDETLAEVNEAIADIIGGRYFLDRTWIQPGPLLGVSDTTPPQVPPEVGP